MIEALGSFVTKSTDKAFPVGIALHYLLGILFALVMVLFVTRSHPVEAYRKAGVSFASTHFLAHILFGVCVGLSLAFFGFDPNLLT